MKLDTIKKDLKIKLGGSLTVGEHAFLENIFSKREINLFQNGNEQPDFENLESWDPEKTIRSELISHVLTTKEIYEVYQQFGLVLKGAYIPTKLDLSSLKIPLKIIFNKCYFAEGIDLNNSEIYAFGLLRSKVKTIYAPRIKVKGLGLLDFSNTQVNGTVDLREAYIENDFKFCGGAIINPNYIALNMSSSRINGNVFLNDSFSAIGKVNLTYSKFSKNLELGNSSITGKDVALDGSDLIVGRHLLIESQINLIGSFYFMRSRIDGSVLWKDTKIESADNNNVISFHGCEIRHSVYFKNNSFKNVLLRIDLAKIVGNLELENSKFHNQSKYTILANRLVVEGNVLRISDCEIKGQASFSDSSISGSIELNNSKFYNPSKTSICFDKSNVGGSFYLNKESIIHGQIRFSNSTIKGQFQCTNSQIFNPKFTVLIIGNTKINGHIHFRDNFRSNGEIDISGSTIGGQLNFNDADVTNELGRVISIQNSNVKGNVFFGKNLKTQGSIYILNCNLPGAIILYEAALVSG